MKLLSDVVESLKGKTIKLGTKNGSGFIFCSKVKDNFKLEMSAKHAYHNAGLKKLKNGIENRLNNLDKIYEDKFNERLKNLKKKDKKSIAKIKASLEQSKQVEKVKLPKLIQEYDYCISTPFLKRPVIDKYADILKEEKGVIVIIIKGYERGGYWLVEEYQKRNKNETKEI